MRRSNGYALSLMIVAALSAVSGCNTSDFDMDLRQNHYGTSDAARGVLERRPKPDSWDRNLSKLSIGNCKIRRHSEIWPIELV